MSDLERDERAMPSRREFVALGIGAFVFAALPGALRRRRRLVRRSVPVMGTIAEFAVVHRDARYAHAAIDAAVGELRRVDRRMTRFSSDSDVGRANLRASASPVEISAETAHVVNEGLRWAESSDGRFDPCLGKAAALWDVGERRVPPAVEHVRGFAGRRLYRTVELDRRRGVPVIHFLEADAAIDLGGIAKGYGVDLAAEALRSYGIFNALVNVGGDLYALGTSEDGDAWKVGIRSPDRPDRLIETLEVSDRAVATSGDYLQYFRYQGRRYHHMLDPETGEPRISKTRSVTVVADTCMAADAAATTAFGLTQAESRRVLAVRAPSAKIVCVV